MKVGGGQNAELELWLGKLFRRGTWEIIPQFSVVPVWGDLIIYGFM